MNWSLWSFGGSRTPILTMGSLQIAVATSMFDHHYHVYCCRKSKEEIRSACLGTKLCMTIALLKILNYFTVDLKMMNQLLFSAPPIVKITC
jgi:Trk-type K+ transport system membrane component